MIKLSFHIHIKTHSEWYCANFGREKYSKNVSLFDFQELHITEAYVQGRTEYIGIFQRYHNTKLLDPRLT